jgi:hypothetical protein
MKKLLCLTAAVSGLLAFAATSQAQILSVEFGSNAIGSNIAGVNPLGNWNFDIGTGGLAPGTTTNVYNLVDSTGLTTSVNLSTLSEGHYSVGSSSFTNPPDANALGDNGLFTAGFIGSYITNASLTFTLSNLSATDTYSLIIYGNGFFSNNPADTYATVGGTTYYAHLLGSQSSFIQATSTTPGAGTNANYFEFTGLTGSSSLTAAITNNSGGGYDGTYAFSVKGFQLIDTTTAAVPEPSTWTLIIGGVIALITYQRRKRGMGLS